MSAVFKKLNLKDQREIVVTNAPVSFEAEIASLSAVSVRRSLAGGAQVSFSLAFVTKQPEVDAIAKQVAQRTSGDAVVWFAYPKQSSKRYKSDIDRDRGWASLGTAGFEPVRMVPIDEDWSALRFRRAGFIKTLSRPKDVALSAAGRAKAGAAKSSAKPRAKRSKK